MKQEEFVEHPLEPIWDEKARVLILGSFPSVKTREQGFYYGHPRNRFWPLLSQLLRIEPPLSVADPARAASCLRAHGIALWDILASCHIIGSGDSSIREARPNQLEPIIAGSQIRRVFCNGRTAYQYYQKFQAAKLDLPYSLLPSTSPANAAWSPERLREAWQVILEDLP